MSDTSNPLKRENLAWHGSPLIRFLARIAVWVWRWHGDHEGQRPWLGRFASHVAVALTLILFVVLGSVKFESIVSASEAAAGIATRNVSANVPATPLASAYYRNASRARITRQVESHTAIPDRPRLEVVTYIVQVGDTAEAIAEAFSLQPTTLLWSNPEMEKMPDLLRVGQALTILPLDGVHHTVEVSDTLQSLAETYKVDVEAIRECAFNTIPVDGQLVAGEKIIIPGGNKPYAAQVVTAYTGPVESEATGAGIFYWPAIGVLTQNYWYAHRAIDIGASVGAAIIASDSGYVSFAGWTDIGYGYLVVLDHANGYQTYYAHLGQIFVVEGQTVSAGEVIGAMGSTGNSTGPHLHFEIRYNGYPTNPWIFLP